MFAPELVIELMGMMELAVLDVPTARLKAICGAKALWLLPTTAETPSMAASS
jgi:hypothetical protein